MSRDENAPVTQRWRLIIERAAGEVAQRDHEIAWEEALAASGLPSARASAGRRAPRITFAVPLPLGIVGEAELAELFFVARRRSVEVRLALESVMPPGTRLRDLHDVWIGTAGLPSLVVAADYRIEPAPEIPAAALTAAAASVLAAHELPRVRGADRRYDLRPLIASIEIEHGSLIRCRLRHDPVLGTGRPDELIAALEERLERSLTPTRIVREGIILADDLAREATGPSVAHPVGVAGQ